MNRCSGKTKDGKPCRAAAGPGGLCFFHANPEAPKKLGHIGGTANKKFTGFDMHVPDKITAADLWQLELQVARGVISGDIPAREAAAAAPFFNLLHRYQPIVDIEKRLAALEQRQESASMQTDSNPRYSAKSDVRNPSEPPVVIPDTDSTNPPSTGDQNEDPDENL